MHTSMLLEMAADGFGERIAFGSLSDGLTYQALADQARRAAGWSAAHRVERVALVDVNSAVVPTLLYGSGLAGVPFVPINYRLADEQLAAVLGRCAPCVAVVADDAVDRTKTIGGITVVTQSEFVDQLARSEPADAGFGDPDDVAILLFTSGTTGQPKAAVLRHRHLTSYVVGTVEFMGADDTDAALVSVPPYHIAGVSAVLSATYAGRRIVYLPSFSADAWVRVAHEEAITHAMVVPTMLGRILEELERDGQGLPNLRHLSFGGGRMPLPVIERALALLPHVDFVNAYGLTETSSTIAVLGPDDHRLAIGSDDPGLRRRLESVGQPLPSVEVEIRDDAGNPVATGEVGELFVRGEQVSGEYADRADTGSDDWFATRDTAYLDDDGYLYLKGRVDDVIVRGGENMSPGEIEDVLTSHPAVAEAAVVGIPDVEWGEAVAAVVVLAPGGTATEADLQKWVQEHLRSSKRPSRVEFRDALPYNEMGKLLRRVLKEDLSRS